MSLIKHTKAQTFVEEIFNASIHGFGALLGISGLVLLMVLATQQQHAAKIVSGAIYGSCLILMYSASTLYHFIQHQGAKKWLQVLDHASIYLLIAGSYTPFTLISLPGGWGWTLFGIIWGLALLGVAFKIFFTGRFEFLSVSIYVLMGWLILIALKPLIHSLPMGGLAWLATGGLCYTLGVIFYALDGKYHFSHFIWHIFVLAGSICQFFAILLYVIW